MLGLYRGCGNATKIGGEYSDERYNHIKSKLILGNSLNFGYVYSIEMEVTPQEIMGMALGLFLGISLMGYIVWLLLQEV